MIKQEYMQPQWCVHQVRRPDDTLGPGNPSPVVFLSPLWGPQHTLREHLLIRLLAHLSPASHPLPRLQVLPLMTLSQCHL